ncbi:MAG: hypothetical protein M5U26_02215 [Planctomycetota bacterium]|nr:hypothetical protein [Planctomycetota bacterium]
MPPESAPPTGNAWLVWALMTVAAWGLYGAFLHTGQLAMKDPANGRYKAFLFVGIAYFLTAVLAPLAVLVLNKASFRDMPMPGMMWSLFAGIVGAAGAFCVLLALGAGGKPIFVMSLIFGGAPVINALYALILHPPEGGWGSVKPQFWLGILLAAAGGALVSLYKPGPAPQKPAQAAPADTPDAAPKPGAVH